MKVTQSGNHLLSTDVTFRKSNKSSSTQGEISSLKKIVHLASNSISWSWKEMIYLSGWGWVSKMSKRGSSFILVTGRQEMMPIGPRRPDSFDKSSDPDAVSASEKWMWNSNSEVLRQSEYGPPGNLSLVICLRHSGRGFRAQVSDGEIIVGREIECNLITGDWVIFIWLMPRMSEVFSKYSFWRQICPK